jgi:hypothetical protein
LLGSKGNSAEKRENESFGTHDAGSSIKIERKQQGWLGKA